MHDPKTPAEKEAYLKEHAGLVWNVGTILVDRRRDYYDPNQDLSVIWDYLYENLDSIYEQVGPTIDYAEGTIFGVCPGHEPGPNDPMGISVYCDGSCQKGVNA